MSLSTSLTVFCTLVCLQIEMVKKRKADVSQDFAFDDDTSDSEEEGLEDFQAKVGQLKNSKPLPAPSNTSEGQDNSDAMEDSDDEGDEGSDDENDSEEESSDEEIAVKPESKLSEEKKLKLSKLQEQLAHIGGEASDSESESEDSDSEEEVGLNNGANHQIDEKVDDEEEAKDETSEGDDDIESDKDQEAEKEDDQDQPENKKVKLTPSMESGEEKARKKYQEQLSKMTIEEIQKLKERLGLKLFHQKLEGTAPERGKKVIL